MENMYARNVLNPNLWYPVSEANQRAVPPHEWDAFYNNMWEYSRYGGGNQVVVCPSGAEDDYEWNLTLRIPDCSGSKRCNELQDLVVPGTPEHCRQGLRKANEHKFVTSLGKQAVADLGSKEFIAREPRSQLTPIREIGSRVLWVPKTQEERQFVGRLAEAKSVSPHKFCGLDQPFVQAASVVSGGYSYEACRKPKEQLELEALLLDEAHVGKAEVEEQEDIRIPYPVASGSQSRPSSGFGLIPFPSSQFERMSDED